VTNLLTLSFFYRTTVIYKDYIEVKYLILPHTIKFEVSDIEEIDYLVGMYDYSMEYDKSVHFKLICFDRLILKKKNGDVLHIKINTSYGGFSKIIDYIEKYLQNSKKLKRTK